MPSRMSRSRKLAVAPLRNRQTVFPQGPSLPLQTSPLPLHPYTYPPGSCKSWDPLHCSSPPVLHSHSSTPRCSLGYWEHRKIQREKPSLPKHPLLPLRVSCVLAWRLQVHHRRSRVTRHYPFSLLDDLSVPSRVGRNRSNRVTILYIEMHGHCLCSARRISIERG